jgi:hypothetical protein
MVSEGSKRHVVMVRVQRSRFASLLFGVLLLAPVSELATDGGQISFGACYYYPLTGCLHFVLFLGIK